jgi:hypothetical protein
MRQSDTRGRVLQGQLRGQKATDRPWLLPLNNLGGSLRDTSSVRGTTMTHPEDWPVEPFLIALRNSVAHGDARTVFPFHRHVANGHELVGFRFKCKVTYSTIERPSHYGRFENLAIWQGEITLLREDMRRIGCALAREFCSALSGDQSYFEQEANTVAEPLQAA